jgi:BirA family biotin operon repressor/biotin-[acetyl-CoA-carboxylase] ligase
VVVGTESAGPLDVTALRDSLRPPWTDLDVVAVTDSTNADLLATAGQRSTGSVLVAEEQRAGRGRLDRSWESAPGSGLTFSVLLRPGAPLDRWGWLPLLAGLAVCDAVAAHTGLQPRMKWPNDVLIGAQELKVAGILAQVGGASGDAVIIGIGINVNATAEQLPVPTATSLRVAAGRALDRTQLLCEVLGELGTRFSLWDAAGGEPNAAGLAADYRDRCATVGRTVTVSQVGGAQVTAQAVDIDASGALVLLEDGQRRLFAAGDVEHVR